MVTQSRIKEASWYYVIQDSTLVTPEPVLFGEVLEILCTLMPITPMDLRQLQDALYLRREPFCILGNAWGTVTVKRASNEQPDAEAAEDL